LSINYKIHSKKQTNLASEVSSLYGELKQIRKNKYAFWYKAVGEQIGKIAIPAYIKNGVLHVSVINPVSRFELSRIKADILKKVNTVLGDNNELKDIIFK
jgi:DNA-binding IclR family transcriptional regulator